MFLLKISEFLNTVSNVPGIVLGLFGLINALRQGFEKRFSVLHISNIILAIGSILHHSSLQRLQQQSDETPMVWEMLLYIYILHSPDWHYQSTMPTFLFLYGAAFAIVHSQVHFGIGFKIHYVILCLLCIPRMYKYYIHTQDMSAKRLAKLHLGTLFIGSLCWLSHRFNGSGIKSSSVSGSSSIREDSETKDTVSTGICNSPILLTMGWFISKDMFEIGVGRNTLFHLIPEMCSDLNP
ncbi:hypothetical protein AAG906_016581 [Vitis piasezkii]